MQEEGGGHPAGAHPDAAPSSQSRFSASRLADRLRSRSRSAKSVETGDDAEEASTRSSPSSIGTIWLTERLGGDDDLVVVTQACRMAQVGLGFTQGDRFHVFSKLLALDHRGPRPASRRRGRLSERDGSSTLNSSSTRRRSQLRRRPLLTLFISPLDQRVLLQPLERLLQELLPVPLSDPEDVVDHGVFQVGCRHAALIGKKVLVNLAICAPHLCPSTQFVLKRSHVLVAIQPPRAQPTHRT